jgi:hypothetical protein
VVAVSAAACRHDYDALARLMTNPFTASDSPAAPATVIAAWRTRDPAGRNLDALAAALSKPPTLDQGGLTFTDEKAQTTFARTPQPNNGNTWSAFTYPDAQPAAATTTPKVTSSPACPSASTLLAAYNRANRAKATSVDHSLCSGTWAGAQVTVTDRSGNANAYSALFQWANNAWVFVPLEEPCSQGKVPSALAVVCNSS